MIDAIAFLVIRGLKADGAHHKQWYLEEIAKILGLDLSEVNYEKGIAP